jgi:hypothetical protein
MKRQAARQVSRNVAGGSALRGSCTVWSMAEFYRRNRAPQCFFPRMNFFLQNRIGGLNESVFNVLAW